MAAGKSGRRVHRLRLGAGRHAGDVAEHAALEQVHALRQVAEVAAEVFARPSVEVGAVEAHLAGREWLVGGGPTIADLSVFGYTHVAGDAGFELERYPAVAAWLERVRALPGFVDNLAPYPENARPGKGRSIYD